MVDGGWWMVNGEWWMVDGCWSHSARSAWIEISMIFTPFDIAVSRNPHGVQMVNGGWLIMNKSAFSVF